MKILLYECIIFSFLAGKNLGGKYLTVIAFGDVIASWTKGLPSCWLGRFILCYILHRGLLDM